MKDEEIRQRAENYATTNYGLLVQGVAIEAYMQGMKDYREHDNTVRSDNTKVIEKLENNVKLLMRQLAGYKKLEKEYINRVKANNGNHTIFQEPNGDIYVHFGEGRVLLSFQEGALKKNNVHVCGVMMSALKEPDKIGMTVFDGKSVQDLAQEGEIYTPSVCLIFENIKSVEAFEFYTAEIKKRLAVPTTKKAE